MSQHINQAAIAALQAARPEYAVGTRDIDVAEMQRRIDAAIAALRVAPLNEGGQGEGVAWSVTGATVRTLAAELIRAAESMGEESDELTLAVKRPGTVAGDDGALNQRHILAVSLAEYPEEGVYPVDPADPTGGRVDAAPQPKADASLPFEAALSELIGKIVPGLDTGDILADARVASSSLSATPSAKSLTDDWRNLMERAAGEIQYLHATAMQSAGFRDNDGSNNSVVVDIRALLAAGQPSEEATRG